MKTLWAHLHVEEHRNEGDRDRQLRQKDGVHFPDKTCNKVNTNNWK